MATFVKFDCFVKDLGDKVHDLAADTLKVYLSNDTPVPATDTVKADVTAITEKNGYAAADITNTWTEAAGTATLGGTDVTWTADTTTDGTGFGPFRYVVVYNDTPTSPADPLVCYWDYGSSITITDTNDFVVDFGASVFTLA